MAVHWMADIPPEAVRTHLEGSDYRIQDKRAALVGLLQPEAGIGYPQEVHTFEVVMSEHLVVLVDSCLVEVLPEGPVEDLHLDMAILVGGRNQM